MSNMLPHGRARKCYRGDTNLPHRQQRFPSIPPFPFHQEHFFPPRIPFIKPELRGLCNPVGRCLFNPVPRVFRFDTVNSALRLPFPNEELRKAYYFPLPKPRPNTLTQEGWDVLNHNGRPEHKAVGVVVCCCTFGEDGSLQRLFSFCCSGISHTEHTENKAIHQVIMLENESGRCLRTLVFINSRSPCLECAEDMLTFFNSRRFSMRLYFTALQEEINPDGNSISLLAACGIPLRIVDEYIWSYLTSLLGVCDGKQRTAFSDGSEVNTTDRKVWDVVWSQRLGEILHHHLPYTLNRQNLASNFNDVKKSLTQEPQRTP